IAQRFGNPGRRIWYMAQGADPAPLQLTTPPPKTIGHGKVMPPNTRDVEIIRTYLLHMAEKVAARLRRHTLAAQVFSIGLRAKTGWIGEKARSMFPTNDGRIIGALCLKVLKQHWHGEGVHQVQITALDPRPVNAQLDLFADNLLADNLFANNTEKRGKTNAVTDAINHRYGEFTLAPARLLNRSNMPNVIAPAWKPFGHRQTIQDTAADARHSQQQSQQRTQHDNN
ncbi:MAG: hypothetical protein KAU29_02540, partial [Gammaproteobacteria bacterium]|nr:hypothetical protein [Gammaproteobacteria bacterium]